MAVAAACVVIKPFRPGPRGELPPGDELCFLRAAAGFCRANVVRAFGKKRIVSAVSKGNRVCAAFEAIARRFSRFQRCEDAGRGSRHVVPRTKDGIIELGGLRERFSRNLEA